MKYAPNREAFNLVYTHCEIVSRIAEQLISHSSLRVDVNLVKVGSLLHDIGVYRLYDTDGRLDHARYVMHGILGHELLREEGLPDVICRFCSCHTGMGISRDDVVRQRLPLPPADYLAESNEEMLVMYADKFHSKSDPPSFVSLGSYSAYIRRFGEDKVGMLELMAGIFGIPDLQPFIDEYGYRAR